MRLLHLTLPTPAENLALDEALLEEAEAADSPFETLRFWESPELFVIAGRSSRVEDEVHYDICRELKVRVFRRISGGASVMAGPGCLMYALILDRGKRADLTTVDNVHRLVLGIMASALAKLAPGTQCRGVSDLAIGHMKFSGNSARCKRKFVLYHGTLMYDFPLDIIARCLAMPPRQPAYRDNRSHAAFVANFPAPLRDILAVLENAWCAAETSAAWPREATQRLAAEKYNCQWWNNPPSD
jgi:lipoate---protein ligase